MDSKQVLAEALRLSPEARAALAGDLLASLDEVTIDDGREAAWSQEIRRRLDAWEQGEMESISGEAFMTNLVGAASGKASP